MTEISIIVPVFRSEKFLGRCIQSILDQSFTDFELILIDDGSPDRCGDICEEYALQDQRISVIHQENRGVSAARNAGIFSAHGKYVAFMDSDDTIDSNYLDTLYSLVVKYRADIGIVSFYPYAESANEIYDNIEKIYNSGEEAVKEIGGQNTYKFRTCCAKLVNIGIALQFPFPEQLCSGEDFATIYKWLFASKRVVDKNIPLYHYNRENEVSLTHKFNLKSLDHLRIDDMLDFFEKNHFEENLRIYSEELITRCAIYINTVQKEMPREKNALRFMRKKLRKAIKKYGQVIKIDTFSQRNYILRTAYPVRHCIKKVIKKVLMRVRSLHP